MRESRLISINEDEGKSTGAGVSAVYQVGKRPTPIPRHSGDTLEPGRSGQCPLRRRSVEGDSRKYNVSVNPQVKFVTAEGHDLPMGLERPDFEHSLPAAPAMEGSIFGLKLNGESLPGIHGGPVRLATPGLFGTMQVKWLRRLRFETAESPNFYHATEYRVPDALLKPGEKFRFTVKNSRPTWDTRLMSCILEPGTGAKPKAGGITVSGVAITMARYEHRARCNTCLA